MFDFFCDLFGEVNKKNYRFQVDSGNKLAIEGYKNLLLVTEEMIELKLFDGELEVKGKNLKIKEFGQNTIIITGDIMTINMGKKQYEKKNK